MASYYTIYITEQDEKHIPQILKLAEKHHAEATYFDTKDGTGYQFEFKFDSNRLLFKDATDKLGLFKNREEI